MTKPHPEAMEPIVIDPCRFCRSAGPHIDLVKPRGVLHGDTFVYCRECKAAGPTAQSVEKAVEWWNNGLIPKPRKAEPKS